MKAYLLQTSRNRLLVLLFVLFFSLLISFALFGKDILSFFWKYRESVAWSLGIGTPVFTTLYYRNRKLYLWIQRNFILPFKVTHSDWHYIVRFKTEDMSDFEKIKKFILGNHKGKIKIISDLANKFDYSVNEKTSYTLEVERLDGIYDIGLRSGDFLVPSYQYEEVLDQIVTFISELDKKITKRVDSDYSITIKFLDKNPYFGFLLQSLPQEYIKDFRLSITLPSQNDTFISADKNKLTVNATNIFHLRKTVFDYLSFSPNITK